MSKDAKRRSVLEELEAIAPRLAHLKKEAHPEEAPAGYFEKLSTEVWRRIEQEKPERRPARESLWGMLWESIRSYLLRPSFGLALFAVTALAIALAVWPEPGTGPAPAAAVLTDEEINDYIDYYIDDFDLSLLAGESLSPAVQMEAPAPEDSLDEKAIEEYLDEILDEIELEELL